MVSMVLYAYIAFANEINTDHIPEYLQLMYKLIVLELESYLPVNIPKYFPFNALLSYIIAFINTYPKGIVYVAQEYSKFAPSGVQFNATFC